MYRLFTFLAALVGGFALASPNGLVAGQVTQNCPEAERRTRASAGALAHVRYLADDTLEGREVGIETARAAAPIGDEPVE